MPSNRILAGLPVPICASAISLPMPAPGTGAGPSLQAPVALHMDLSKELVPHPQHTFIQRATGDSMEGAGIFDGDLLVVDKQLEPQHGDIVVALVDGEFTCKRYSCSEGLCTLQPENPGASSPAPTSEQDIDIWGVVTNSVRRFRRP